MDDLISRQAAIDALNGIASDLHARKRLDEEYIASWCAETIEQMPSAQPERKTGHWERHNTYYGDDVSGSIDPDWRCSECGGQANVNAWCMYDLTDFCPHCGARMVQEGEDNGQTN